MKRDEWSIPDLMKFELCNRSSGAALTYGAVGVSLLYFPLFTNPDYLLPFRIAAFFLVAISIPRGLMAWWIVRSEPDLKHFHFLYKFNYFLSLLTSFSLGLAMSIALHDPLLSESTGYLCWAIMFAVGGGAISSLSLEPVLHKALLLFAGAMPVATFLLSSHAAPLNFQLMGAMGAIYMFYCFFSGQQFHKKTAERYATHRDLKVERRNLKKALEEVQLAQGETLLQKAKAEQSARMAALGQMAGGIAHEINSPLAIISLSTEILRRSANEPVPDRTAILARVEMIQATTERIAKIIKGLLLFSREDAVEMLAPCSLTGLIEGTLSLCREKFQSAGLRIEFSPPQDFIIEASEVQISQVLLNLLNNAFDASRGQADAWIRIEVKDLGAEIEVAIENSGPTVAENVREKMFQPFFTTKDVGKGTGLGLSLSRGIIEGHGGQLQFDSTCSHPRFFLRLPKGHESVVTH